MDLDKIVTYIPLIIAAIFGLFAIFGMFWGLVRGLKKTTFRTIWIVVTAVALLFITPMVTKFVVSLELPFLGNIVGVSSITNINELMVYYIKKIPKYGTLIASSTKALDAMVTLATLIINAIVYGLLFWVVKIVLYPVWSIISGIVYKKRDKNGNKVKRHRGFGMIVGIVLGLFVGATTLMPVLGIVNMARQIELDTTSPYVKTVTNEDGTTTEVDAVGGALSQLGLENIVGYINLYADSTTSKVLKLTGVEAYQNFMFNTLSTGKSGEEKIVLKDDVKSILVSVNSVNTLTKTDFTTLNQTKVYNLIESCRVLVDKVFDIQIVKLVGDDLFAVVINDIVDNPNSVIKLPSMGSVSLDEGIKQGVATLKDFTFSGLENEINAILDIADALNDEDILCKILNKEVTKIPDITALFDETTTNKIVDGLFRMQTMSSLLPIVINTGLSYGAELLEVTDFEVNGENVTVDSVKETFKTLLNSVLAVSNSLDFDSKYYITNTSLPLAGKVLDAVKDYDGIDQVNYKKLVNKLEDKAESMLADMLKSMDDKMSGIKTAILSSIDNLSEVTNFETEFTKINFAYDNIMSVLDGISATPMKIEFAKVGAVLDAVKTTQLLGGAVNNIITSALDYVKELVPAQFIDLKPVIENVKTKVATTPSWETELNKLSGFYDLIIDVFDSEDLQGALLNDDSTLLTDIGTQLNTLQTSHLFSAEVKNIVKVLIDQVGTFTSGNAGMLGDSLTKIKANIDTATDINWQTEFGTLKTLVTTLLDLAGTGLTEDAFENIGETLDTILASNSKLVNRDVVCTMIDSAVDQFAGNVATGSDMENIVTKIKNEIKTNVDISFKQELKALNSLITDISSINMDTLNYGEFGATLDSYDKDTGTKKSVVITKVRPDIVEMIFNKVDTTSFDDGMEAIFDTMKDNCRNIVNFELEFVLLDDFIDTVNGLTTVSFDSFNFVSFGTKMDDYGASATIGPARSDIMNFIVNKITLTNDKPAIQTAITNILNETKNCSAKVTAGTLTYVKVFTDLKELKNLTTALTTVTVNRNNVSAINTLGAKLDELNALVIVPEIEAVRIAKYVVDEIDANMSTLLSDVDETIRNDSMVQDLFSQVVGRVEELQTSYNNYLTAEAPEEKATTFAEDFNDIANYITEINAKIQEIEEAIANA